MLTWRIDPTRRILLANSRWDHWGDFRPGALRRNGNQPVHRAPPLLLCSVLLLASCVLGGCVEEEPPEPLDPANFTDVSCLTEAETRCSGATFQSCRSGYWYNEEHCTSGLVCSYSLGCTPCDPLVGPVCVGDEIYSCTPEGEFGSLLEVCEPDQCYFNHCEEEDCPDGSDLIYVVDSSYRLLSFDPSDDLHVFNLRGNLNCPAGQTLPGWGGLGSATPFSMSVDRSGQAWVLYTSGQIFWTDANNPEFCTLSPWQSGTEGFELFGMGFVTDAPGAGTEKLYIAGGTVTQMATHATGRLGVMDPIDMSFSVAGSLTPSEFSPELTGTGDAELFAYFPGMASSGIAMLDRSNGSNAASWQIPPLPGALRAWAFAHWGGRYYIFVTYLDPFGGEVSQVHRFDPELGEAEIILEDIPYVIVGAGVSTCAPTVFD